MNVVIIEDEVEVAWELQNIIKKVRPNFIVKALLDSVEGAVDWFLQNPAPDLIFSDIQLGDGLAFKIYKKIQVKCPVIFCTAFDQYAIEAFKNNGIDYLLKPVKEQDLEASLKKIMLFKQTVSPQIDNDYFLKVLQQIEFSSKKYKSTFLVSFRDRLIPLPISEVKLFYKEQDKLHLYTGNGKLYHLNETLDQLETQIDPHLFYRANRQYLVAFHSIKEVEHHEDRKLLIKLNSGYTEPIIVSKARSSDFIKWMGER